jgi:thiol-disulfide isomerase/thioredoxin
MRCESTAPPAPARRAFLKGCAASLLAWQQLGRRADANELRVGAPAPVATLVTLEGQTLRSSDFAGQVVVLTFFATWCPPCRGELPLLAQFAARHAADGLRVLGFSLDGAGIAHGGHAGWPSRYPSPWACWSRSDVSGYGRIWRLPVNFTIDRSGRLRNDGWREHQPAWTAERLEQIVLPLLV